MGGVWAESGRAGVHRCTRARAVDTLYLLQYKTWIFFAMVSIYLYSCSSGVCCTHLKSGGCMISSLSIFLSCRFYISRARYLVFIILQRSLCARARISGTTAAVRVVCRRHSPPALPLALHAHTLHTPRRDRRLTCVVCTRCVCARRCHRDEASRLTWHGGIEAHLKRRGVRGSLGRGPGQELLGLRKQASQ